MRIAAALALAYYLQPSDVSAQQVVNYSYFSNLTSGQLGGVRMRIANFATGERSERSLVLATSQPADTIGPFVPFRKAGYEYFDEDLLGADVVILSAVQLEALIDSVGAITEATDGGIDSSARMAVGLVRTDVGPNVGFESLVNGKTVRQVLGRMRGALSASIPGYGQVMQRACRRGIEFGPPPAEVTGDVSVRYGGAKLDLRKQAYAVRVSVTNDSNHAITGPMYLVLGVLPPDQELLGLEESTCSIRPKGAAVVKLPIGASLARDATVSTTLFFRSTHKVRLSYDRRVFAGPGER